jgi:hypothetical protein
MNAILLSYKELCWVKTSNFWAWRPAVKKLLGVLFILAASEAFAGGRNPIGETAYYQLDKRNGRTSSMIKSGNFIAEVNGVSANAAIPSFDVAINYEFDVSWMGQQSGTEIAAIDQQYFSEEFLEEIRVTGHYSSPEFKVRHTGYANVVNMDGTRYNNCDKLLFYDIKTGSANVFSKVLLAAAQAMMREEIGESVDENRIEDLQILAHVKYGQPVLGAVKLDVTGKYNGMRVKAGGDYVPR